MQQISAQVLVLGGGPGGYSCASRAAKLGLDVVLVEADRPGGTCLHAGCIPSKALIHAAQRMHENRAAARGEGVLSAIGLKLGAPELDFAATQAWKNSIVETLAGGVDALLANSGVRVIRGQAQLRDGKHCQVVTTHAGSDSDTGHASVDGSVIEIAATNVVLALGATEVELPELPPGDDVFYASQALAMSELPKRLAVVGAGYIGLELGQAFARLGVEVTVIEALERLLPAYPASLTSPLKKALGVLTNTRAGRFADQALGITEGASGGAKGDAEGTTSTIAADKVLVAVGRQGNLEGWGRENLALDLVDGFVAIDNCCETSMSGVYAVGDLTGEPMLAHRALAQGRIVAERLAGRRREFAPNAIPAVCFTAPEIASVGETAASARAAGLSVLTQRMPMTANGRALTLGDANGFIELVADADNHALLGVHVVGEHVAELIHSFTLALEMGARLEDIADTIHAHPTLGESFQDAAHAALGLDGS